MGLIDKKIEKEFSVCDVCGYDRGFHVSFVKKDHVQEIILICPECGSKFRVNWEIKLV